MKISAIKAPRYGEERRSILEDLALITGATLVSKDSGISLRNVKLEHLGCAKRVETSKRHTTIADGETDYDELDKRIVSLKAQLEQTETLPEAERIQERITRLSSGVAVRSAQEEGIVPGGGSTLLKAANSVGDLNPTNQDQLRGAQTLLEACFAPITQILNNAEVSSDIVVSSLTHDDHDKNVGFNVRTEKFENLVETGVIDPAKTVKCALRNAASAAGTLLTTNCAVLRKGGE
jgi:chaperonin GroEL